MTFYLGTEWPFAHLPIYFVLREWSVRTYLCENGWLKLMHIHYMFVRPAQRCPFSSLFTDERTNQVCNVFHAASENPMRNAPNATNFSSEQPC